MANLNNFRLYCHICRRTSSAVNLIINRLSHSDAYQNREPPSRPQVHHTIDEEEVAKFNRMAAHMWKESGEFKALHAMNALRVPLVRDGLIDDRVQSRTPYPLEGKMILDAGCGGGILAEPLARLGAFIVGVDASENNIQIAQAHMNKDSRLGRKIKYIHATVDDLIGTEEGKFDGVVASEVLEHVADVESFVSSCCRLVRPGGSMFLTTINKTQLSYYMGIIGAENILGIVPRGTHDWEKFIDPNHLKFMLIKNGFTVKLIHGMIYNPLTGRWSWIKDQSISYAIHATKERRIDENQSTSESSSDSGVDEAVR